MKNIKQLCPIFVQSELRFSHRSLTKVKRLQRLQRHQDATAERRRHCGHFFPSFRFHGGNVRKVYGGCSRLKHVGMLNIYRNG